MIKQGMSPDYLSQNMAVLKQNYPLLAEELSKAEDNVDEEELKSETSASGSPTLLFRGVYIHSKRDPEREAERLIESAVTGAAGNADEGNPALVLGFGLGYGAAALATKFPGRPIIVVERHPAVIKKALETRDLADFLARTRLVFILGGNGEGVTGALSLFESVPGVPPLVIRNRALTGKDEEWYKGAEDRIMTWNSRTNVNRATQKRFGKRWVRNLSKNLHSIPDFPGIARLEEIVKDKIRGGDIPVFLAAGGPGLDAAGPILTDIHKRCVTIAVDTSLRFLLGRGIAPDFVVSVDPQFWNSRHLDRVPAPGTRLIAESAVYPPVLRGRFGGIFLSGSFFPLGRFIENKVDPKGELGAGGSVATSAWDFARLLGTRQVWIAGLDLSFPELKTHFKGAAFEEKSHAESCRFSPAEAWNFHALRDGQPFLARQMGGGAVLTDKRLSLYASWFENRFSQFPEIRNYSLGKTGLEIKGLEPVPAETLLALPERREEIENLLNRAYNSINEAFNQAESRKTRTEKYENAREALFQGLSDIKKQADEAAKIAGNAAAQCDLGRLDEQNQKKTLNKLDSANKCIAESAVKEIAGFLFPETSGWEEEIAAESSLPLIRHLKFSARFYRALAEAAEYNLLKLRK